MKSMIITGFGVLLASAGNAGAQAYYSQSGYAPPAYSQSGYSACPPNYHNGPQGCVCNQQAQFYSPSGSGYYPVTGTPPYAGYSPTGGYNVRLYSPGVRVSGQPVEVASGEVYVEGAPIYVQAPPVRVASPQIYLQRPKVYVQPSQVTVEPPTVHVAGCENGESCEMVGTSQSSAAPTHAHYTRASH